MTLHLNVSADRQQVGDVAAIYLVQPTRDNVARIGKDCAAGLYDSMHLNFSSTIASDQLHSLATTVAETEGGQQRIAKVFDQHMHFVSLDHRLFSLMMANSYARLNDPEISDAEMEVTQPAHHTPSLKWKRAEPGAPPAYDESIARNQHLLP